MVAALLIACFFSEIHYSANYLTKSEYSIKTDKTSASFKAVLASDLHNKEYGEHNRRLLDAIKSEKPDVIFSVGDLLNRQDENRLVCIEFLTELNKIAPVYCCLGNHEDAYTDTQALKTDIINTGATLLSNSMETVELGGGSFTVGALADYPFYDWDAPNFENPNRYFLDSFQEQQKENFSILLAHQPEYYYWTFSEMDFDLILSGHTHGGIIRLPFVGGLLAPNQGFLARRGLLPTYTKGYYSTDSSKIIISAGLGNEVLLPRFNNPPEYCIIYVN